MDRRTQIYRALLTGMALCFLIAKSMVAQTFEDGWVERLLSAHPERFGGVLARSREHRLQILVSEVTTSDAGRVSLRRHGYRVDAENFYPASAIKLAGAVAAATVVESLDGVSFETPMRFHPLFEGEELETDDPSNLAGGKITVGHEIRKLFLVSDNEAFNRLYELTGHREINELMHEAGLSSVRILHRLDEFRSPEDQRKTPRIDFLPDGGEMLTIPERESEALWENEGLAGLEIGAAHVSGGKKVEAPLSFRHKNRISLIDLQDLLVLTLRPDIDLGKPGFELNEPHRDFLRRAMSEVPAESENPAYDPAEFPDDYVKFVLPGLLRVAPKSAFSIFDKTGRAYGFSLENAYVEHRPSGRAFFLTAVLYTNPNGVLNDDDYAYEDVADPFLADLGEMVARSFWSR